MGKRARYNNPHNRTLSSLNGTCCYGFVVDGLYDANHYSANYYVIENGTAVQRLAIVRSIYGRIYSTNDPVVFIYANYDGNLSWIDVTSLSPYIFGTPVTCGETNSQGSASTISRSDHVHQIVWGSNV